MDKQHPDSTQFHLLYSSLPKLDKEEEEAGSEMILDDDNNKIETLEWDDDQSQCRICQSSFNISKMGVTCQSCFYDFCHLCSYESGVYYNASSSFEDDDNDEDNDDFMCNKCKCAFVTSNYKQPTILYSSS